MNGRADMRTNVDSPAPQLSSSSQTRFGNLLRRGLAHVHDCGAVEVDSIFGERRRLAKPEVAGDRLVHLIHTAIVLIHWSEHLAQAFQVYVLGWPLKEARGVLGMPFPWLVGSEALHYAYALIMLVAFWTLRKGFVGRSYYWWMAAFWIQFWHHIEHALLQYQVVWGDNFFGAPAPISLIQMLGFLEGTPGTGFGGLLTGPPQHPFSALMIAVRRLEVHLFYNSIVTIPMVVAMFYHMFPSPGEEAHMGCNCVWHRKVPVGKAA